MNKNKRMMDYDDYVDLEDNIALPKQCNLKIEKIRKEKRSERGRIIDDWIIDNVSKKENVNEKIEKLLVLGLRRGRVIEVHKKNIFIAEENKDGYPNTDLLWICTVAKKHFQRAHKERNFVVVGDCILFEPDKSLQMDKDNQPLNTNLPQGVIQHAFTRTSRIARQDPLNKNWEHIMLANIDIIIIVASVLNPEVRWGLIDRMLVQAEFDNIPALIILNKKDLLKNSKLATKDFLEKYHKRVEIYRQIGYEVIEIAAQYPRLTPKSIIKLKNLIKGKLVGFCGHSGVGKSSVINLFKPEFEQYCDDNPDIFYKGRHTTTYNSLLKLGIGAYAIDTPGIRTFAINELDTITLSACFKEFAKYKCKYRECTHDKEPDCQIKEAVAKGEISSERYRSFMGLLKGISSREGEGNVADAEMLADLNARAMVRDQILNDDIIKQEEQTEKMPNEEKIAKKSLRLRVRKLKLDKK